MIHIDTLSWQDAQPHSRTIRERVFIVEQHVPVALEWDDEDATADHFLASIDQHHAALSTAMATDATHQPPHLDDASAASEPHYVGNARLLRSGQIGRMAVLVQWRQRGVGAKLLSACEDRALQLGLDRVFCHAQVAVEGFYQRAGYQRSGEPFMDAGIPHIHMHKTLPE